MQISSYVFCIKKITKQALKMSPKTHVSYYTVHLTLCFKVNKVAMQLTEKIIQHTLFDHVT